MNVLVGEDPADHNDIIVEVSAGVGGQEAMLFAAEVLNMYCNYAYHKGWTVTGLTTERNEIGNIYGHIVVSVYILLCNISVNLATIMTFSVSTKGLNCMSTHLHLLSCFLCILITLPILFPC